MALPDYPKIIPSAFASSGDKADIPNNNAGTGRLDYANGFPIETQLPVQAGGVPPQRLDFNGALFELSQHTYFQQSGGQYNWSDLLDYLKNALVVGSDDRIYKCLEENGPNTALGVVDPTNDPFKAWSEFGGSVEIPDASYDEKGILQFATLSETLQGILANKAVNPVNLRQTYVSVAFDNVSSSGAKIVSEWSIPDYSSPLSRLANTTYATPEPGGVLVQNVIIGPGGTNLISIDNNSVINQQSIGGQGLLFSICLPLKAGDNVQSNNNWTFYPYKGV